MYDDDFEIDLINDLATGSDAVYAPDLDVGMGSATLATPADLQMIHEDIQSLHWSILCIYVVAFFVWVCKQWR